MRITTFRIENFRNIRLAECDSPPDFMVICGGNGCGKSAVLQALMTAKERTGAYGHYRFDPRVVSADATHATVSMTLEFSATEREFVETQWQQECPEVDDIVVEIERGGGVRSTKRSVAAHQLLSHYSKSVLKSAGFFDFIDAHRFAPRKQLSVWNAEFLDDDRAKQTLGAAGSDKFQFTKEYLAALVMRDAQEMMRSKREGHPTYPDSLKPIRDFFDSFFAPMTFEEVRIDTSPFQFTIGTPRGEIDIDDLSGGEKEVLNVFVRFHQLDPKGAIILFDEADAHLHPDLDRRYIEVLREIGKGNQLWLTTHSPEMMMAAGSESLYTILKEQPSVGGNQFVRVSDSQQLHEALAEVMGSRGIVSFNQRIVFIEGEESSADREVYERLYPPRHYNISFVPAGNSTTTRKTADRIAELLSSATPFQQYYCIVDGDIEGSANAPSGGGRLFQLPVYHVENLLLDPRAILGVTRDMLASDCPYGSTAEVESALKEIVLGDAHVKPYARALLDWRLAKVAKLAHDAVYTDRHSTRAAAVPTFAAAEADAISEMREALGDGTWRTRCKGRALMKGYCARHRLNYRHFRNCLIAKIGTPPKALSAIMNQILA